jgi:hypothetical protein
VAYVWVKFSRQWVWILGYRLQGLLDAFRAGEVDFVQVWSEEVWPEPDFDGGELVVHGIDIIDRRR